MTVNALIICLNNIIGANATCIDCLENVLDLQCLSTTVGDNNTKVDFVCRDLDQHVWWRYLAQNNVLGGF